MKKYIILITFLFFGSNFYSQKNISSKTFKKAINKTIACLQSRDSISYMNLADVDTMLKVISFNKDSFNLFTYEKIKQNPKRINKFFLENFRLLFRQLDYLYPNTKHTFVFSSYEIENKFSDGLTTDYGIAIYLKINNEKYELGIRLIEYNNKLYYFESINPALATSTRWH